MSLRFCLGAMDYSHGIFQKPFFSSLCRRNLDQPL